MQFATFETPAFNNQIVWYDKNREKSSINITTSTPLYFPINNTTTGPFSITIRTHIDGSTTLCIHSICFKQANFTHSQASYDPLNASNIIFKLPMAKKTNEKERGRQGETSQRKDGYSEMAEQE
uniref:Uncharacterized protein n=1 Tax=Glossina austeni TaxID=7395 RepID=A0A1A9VPT0_GLOAU